MPGTLVGLPRITGRKVGMTSSQDAPYAQGDTRATMVDTGTPTREGELIPQSQPQFGLEFATRLHEAGIASNRGSAMPR